MYEIKQGDCIELMKNLPNKSLDAGDYELKGDAIDWQNNWHRGKVIVCTVDREE